MCLILNLAESLHDLLRPTIIPICVFFAHFSESLLDFLLGRAKMAPKASLLIVLVSLTAMAAMSEANPSLRSLFKSFALRRSARSTPSDHRYMQLPLYFTEYCTSENCTAAQTSTSASPTAPLCPLVHNRPLLLNSTNIAAEVLLSPHLYDDEKNFYSLYSVIYADGQVISSEDNQFSTSEYRHLYYDPTRYPPIYHKWACNQANEACRLPSSNNASAPTIGVCRVMCTDRLVLRLVQKSESCQIPESGVLTSGHYVWAWCMEPASVGLYCAPTSTYHEGGSTCDLSQSLASYCFNFQHFAG